MAIESSTTEQTAGEYLKSQTEIGKQKKYTDYLDKLGNQDKSKEQANVIKNDESILSGMKDLLKSKVDNIIAKGEQIDDNEAKMLIAYDALKNGYLERKIPDNITERQTIALRIANEINNVKKFDTHQTKDRYYNFATNTYSETKSDNTLDLNIDGITSIDTGNTVINAFIKKNDALNNYLIYQKKQNQLHTIMNATRNMNNDPDTTSNRAMLYKQANDKGSSLRQENKNVRNDIKKLSDDPKECMKLAALLHDNKEAFNTPSNEEMVELKDKFMDLITSSYTTRKESNTLYNNREDLGRDDGISRGQNGEIIKTEPKLENNNISLFDNGGKMFVKNNVTNISLEVNENTFKKGIDNREESKNNQDLMGEYRKTFEEQYMKDNNLAKEDIKQMTDQEQRKINQDMNMAMITDVFTKDEKLYTTFMTEVAKDQDGPQSLRGEGLGEAFNAILTKINGSELVGFDCTVGRTTWEIKSTPDGNKYIELKQGKSLVTFGFEKGVAKIFEKTIDTRSQVEKQKDEATEQEKLVVDSKTTIDTYEPQDRIPDLRRALHKIDMPTERDGIHHINLNDLNLTDKDVAFLSTKLGELKDKNEKYTVNLNNNVLEHAPKSIFTMKHITGVDLSSNNLESLPKIEEKDGTTDHITSLDVSKNSFDYSPEVTQFKKLTSLDISSNNISNINDITSLEGITTLKADDIGLKTVPTTLGNMKSIQVLSLDDNEITELPSDFTKLTALTNLDLGNNDLEGPITVSQCPNLKTIDVSGNEDMKNFPIIGTNNIIEDIYCDHTKIKNIPTGIKEQCPNLKKIDIYDDIVTGTEAKNQFLDGSLTTNGYEFKQDGQKKETSQMKTFFESKQTFKYTKISAKNETDAIIQAKDNLGLDATATDTPYAIKKSTSGVEIYMFAGAEKNKDRL